MADGTERVMRAGEFFYVPPGHDSWVVGDEPYVSLHIMGSESYARADATPRLPARSGNCYKVRLLLAQLGVDYERVDVDIFDGGTLTDEFGALNPTRTTPVLETDAGEAVIESNAILVYLAEGSELLPDDPVERAQVLRWLFYEQAEIVPSDRRPAGAAGGRRAGARQPAAPGRLARGRGRVAAARGAPARAHLPRRRALHDRRHLHLRLRPRGRRRRPRPRRVPGGERLDRARGGHPAATWTTCEPIPPDTRFGVGRSIYG